MILQLGVFWLAKLGFLIYLIYKMQVPRAFIAWKGIKNIYAIQGISENFTTLINNVSENKR
jgi:hypothetical protein